MKRVTIKMIAEEAGVSIGTVDRALNNRGRINENTKREILHFAQAMGYQPNKIASALRKKKINRVAVVMPRYPNYFTDELIVGVEGARRDLEDFGAEIEYIFSDTLDPEEQETILNNLDLSKYSGVALNAGGECLSVCIDKIVENNVPVVTFNTDVKESKRLFYVGEMPYSAGRIAGNLMSKMLGGHGNVAIFVGFKTVSSHKERASGFIDYIKEFYPSIEIAEIVEHHDDDIFANQKMTDMIASKKKMDGIFCVSTPGVVGVGQAMLDHGLGNNICLIGYDINQKSAQFLKEGFCDAIMYQDPQKQSYKAITLLINYLNGYWHPETAYYPTKTKIVVAENLDDYTGDYHLQEDE